MKRTLHNWVIDGPRNQRGLPSTVLATLVWWRSWAIAAVIGSGFTLALWITTYEVSTSTAVFASVFIGMAIERVSMSISSKYNVEKNF